MYVSELYREIMYAVCMCIATIGIFRTVFKYLNEWLKLACAAVLGCLLRMWVINFN